MTSLEMPVAVKSMDTTTGECFACGKRYRLSLLDSSVIECECGWMCDRDVNAALVILRKELGLNPDQAVGLEWPEIKFPEKGYWGAPSTSA